MLKGTPPAVFKGTGRMRVAVTCMLHCAAVWEARLTRTLPQLLPPPCSILALEAICDSALSNVRELQATHSRRSGPSSSSRRRVSASELVQLGTNDEARRAQRVQRDGSSTRGVGGTEGGSASGTDSDPEWGYTAGAALMTLDTPEPFSQWAGNGILPRTPAAVQSEKRAPAAAAQHEEHAPAAAVQSEKHAPAAAERGKDGAA